MELFMYCLEMKLRILMVLLLENYLELRRLE
jgi:hypothetical protein